jgi:hypothetical protein
LNNSSGIISSTDCETEVSIDTFQNETDCSQHRTWNDRKRKISGSSDDFLNINDNDNDHDHDKMILELPLNDFSQNSQSILPDSLKNLAGS